MLVAAVMIKPVTSLSQAIQCQLQYDASRQTVGGWFDLFKTCMII